MTKNLLIDRTHMTWLLLQIKGLPIPINLINYEAVASKYDKIFYEASGISAFEFPLARSYFWQSRMVAIPSAVHLSRSEEEGAYLTHTLENALDHPLILAALQTFQNEKGGPARSAKQILNYIMRLLLLGRKFSADILVWRPRIELVRALFAASGYQLISDPFLPYMSMTQVGPCRFPYLPRKHSPGNLFRFLSEEIQSGSMVASLSSSSPSRSSLRDVLSRVLKTDSDFNAFCLDQFVETYRHFTEGMNRVEKMNILLEREDLAVIWQRLQVTKPNDCARFLHLIEMVPNA